MYFGKMPSMIIAIAVRILLKGKKVQFATKKRSTALCIIIEKIVLIN